MCKAWGIPFLSLEGVNPQEIPQLVENMEQKPRVILCTISTVADAGVQKHIRRLPVRTICLDEVQVLNEDRILRRYLDLIKATLRTNFYQNDDEGDARACRHRLGSERLGRRGRPHHTTV